MFVLQLRQRGVVCRETSNECDLPEHCNGDAGTCPPDVHKKNGNPCGELNNPGHCYSGFCPTLNVQCQAIWGYGMLLPLSSYVYILYVHILRDSQHIQNSNGSNHLPYLRTEPVGPLQCRQKRLLRTKYNL